MHRRRLLSDRIALKLFWGIDFGVGAKVTCSDGDDASKDGQGESFRRHIAVSSREIRRNAGAENWKENNENVSSS